MHKSIQPILLTACFAFLFCSVGMKTARAQSSCDDPSSYVPTVPEHTPIIRVRLCFHIMQKADGTGNFRDIPEHRKFLKDVMWSANECMINNPKMVLPTTSAHIPDTRIRFVLDERDIYYHRDEDGWNLYEKDNIGRRARKASHLYKKYVVNSDSIRYKENAIHLFLGEGQESGHPEAEGVASGIGHAKWICAVNYYAFFQREKPNFWLPGNVLRHEIGHCMGLLHPMRSGSKPGPANDHCDDTPTYPVNDGTWGAGPGISNNVMSYNAVQGAFTECQLGRSHYYLMGNKGTVHNAVIPDWQILDPNADITIETGDSVVWNCKKLLHGSITIQTGASLTLRCLTHLPQGARVTIQDGGQLILDGGHLTNIIEGQKWRGIYANKKAKVPPVRVLNGGGVDRCKRKTAKYIAEEN